MGRGYVVDDAVEGYLSKLCEPPADRVSGLLIGQSSSQRDFVIMASRTPLREAASSAAGKSLEKEWVTEHARQVSRMLPGGLSVLGVFIITDADAKDTVTTLRQLVFAVENLISTEYLWNPAADDVTDCVTLHVNPKTRKTVCRTFDVRDPKSFGAFATSIVRWTEVAQSVETLLGQEGGRPKSSCRPLFPAKSTARPADWKYQSGVCSSWSVVSCCLNVDVLVPLPDNRTIAGSMDTCLKEGLKGWAHQIQSGRFLMEGKMLPDDTELSVGQRRNTRQTCTIQLLISPDLQDEVAIAGQQLISQEHQSSAVVQQCAGSVSVRGAIHSRAYIHSHKPKAQLAEKLLKRDVLSTVASRVQMLLEELLISEEGSSKDAQHTDQFCIPRRIFCPVKAFGPVCVCDYQFSDESQLEVIGRLKEMLDMDVAEEDLDTTQERPAHIIETGIRDCGTEPTVEPAEALEPQRNNYVGVVVATAVVLLASAVSVLYLNDM